MGFEMRGIDHQSVGLAGFACKRFENPVEDAKPAPANEAVIERLVRAVVNGPGFAGDRLV
jgi:hypothetical protein